MAVHIKMISLLVLVGFFLAVVCGFAAMLAGLGSRWGWWHYRTGFKMLKWSAYGGLFSAFVCGAAFIGAFFARIYDGVILAMLGALIGLVTAGNVRSWKQSVDRLPPIHDITTDTEYPPLFSAVLPLRKDAPNPSEYGGPPVAALQHKAYPDIKPRVVNLSVAHAHQRALEIARGMRWNIIHADGDAGRIEAVATTFWFGFKDDIVIRITPEGTRSLIDVRSVSRVGKTDAGTNAKRIRSFLKQMRT
jgi:uncharacterized protein (DUF1499 family)